MDTPVVLGGSPLGRLPESPWPLAAGPERERLARVVESGVWAFDGPFEQAFEEAFAAEQTARFGLCVANGTVALQLALEALEIGFGDEVIVPGFTWQATVAAVLDVNATPVLVDVEPENYCIDPQAAEAAVTDRTRAIIVVHLYDGIADMDRILEIAARRRLAVIEDCAHSHGSRWNDRGVGSLGDIGTFSFQSSKSLTAGEGGFITTSSATLRERLYSLRNCGRRRPGSSDAEWQPIQSGNYRMSEWQSAVLLSQLEHFPGQLATRQDGVRYLDSELTTIPGISTTLRRPQVTRQGLYGYVLRYDEEAFGGLSGRGFQEALSAELGTTIGPPYEPLNASPLLQPHTKPRHHLNDDYWRRIDPRQYRLPVAEHAYRSEASIIPHELLLLPTSELALIPAAIRRLSRHASALADRQRSSRAVAAASPA
ncbi:MAG: DegT/DnrJ/EryC1/StrS family aminotransferase [Chloroflexi bacterium]|nr:DegT/DnrJ/EryC1/StrS family aminotransferase [Chloroflexota bacterium]